VTLGVRDCWYVVNTVWYMLSCPVTRFTPFLSGRLARSQRSKRAGRARGAARAHSSQHTPPRGSHCQPSLGEAGR
jgi:hypothetical protein